MFEKIKEEYRSTLKSSDTEEHIDLAFYRPLGYAWACLFRRLGVHPNAVTIASIFLGIGAAFCFYPADIYINLIGIGLLIWANTYDSADGQLARLTKQYSPLGRILDGAAGDVWFVSIYIAICLRAVRDTEFFTIHPALVWILAAVAGLCHARQAALAAYYRQAHLFCLKGSGGSELDSSEPIREKLNNLMASRKYAQALPAMVYLGYTTAQERQTPEFQRLKTAVKGMDTDSNAFHRLREDFLRHSRPLCKWENFMTFNWRSICLFGCIIAGFPWVYFIIEITVFNIVLLYTRITHEKACKALCATYCGQENGSSKIRFAR